MNKIIILLSIAVLMPACQGTRDYPEPNAELTDDEPNERGLEAPIEEVMAADDKPSVGYLWQGLEWVGVPDESLEKFKGRLDDDPQTHTFRAFGGSVFGGAALGLIIRASGSWFLGAPSDSESGHWFWIRLKSTVQGLFRGGMFAGGCHILLSGINPLPYNGLLGDGFTALSSSIALGGTTSVATAALVARLTREDWSDESSLVGKIIRRTFRSEKIGKSVKIQEWTNTSDLGRALRYRLIPGFFIIGIGSGVGVIVYHSLQDSDLRE